MNNNQIGNDIIDVLNSNNHYELANELNIWLQILHNGNYNEKENAKKEIVMRCNVRWLGDIYISTLSQDQWWSMLEKLAKKVKKY